MQKNDKSYTFLLSHSKKSSIYIKRVEVPRNYLRNGLFSLGIFTILSFVSVGVYAVAANFSETDNTIAASSHSAAAVQSHISADQMKPNSFDYSRPVNEDDLSMNSGGPDDEDGSESDLEEMERQLKSIQSASGPANLPTVWAHLGKINNEFGFRRNPFGGRTYEFHAGMDIDGERGDPVVAPAGGTVTEAGWKGGYGQMVEIDHGNGLKTRYGHLSRIGVTAGDTVPRGQVIGLVGSTGRSTGPHLHYELRLNNRPINPRRFLPSEPTQLKKIQG